LTPNAGVAELTDALDSKSAYLSDCCCHACANNRDGKQTEETGQRLIGLKFGVDLISDVLPFGRLWYIYLSHAIVGRNLQSIT
jgi:hypothetical protein